MAANPRAAAVAALVRQEQDGFSNLVLDAELRRQKLEGRDKAFAGAIFYTVLEHQGTLDFILEQFLPKGLARLDPQAALEDTVYFEKTRAAIVDTRAWTKQQLEARGFAVLDSRSNFLFASTQKKNGGELYRKLKKQGVLVRHFDAPRIENWLRITIGTPKQMQIFLNTLDKMKLVRARISRNI